MSENPCHICGAGPNDLCSDEDEMLHIPSTDCALQFALDLSPIEYHIMDGTNDDEN